MRLLLVDYLVALYNIILIAVWSPLAATSGTARWMIAVHCAALSLPFLLAHLPEPRTRFVRWLRDVYPLAWVLVFWRELGIHCSLVVSAQNDAFIAGLDRALFGVNLNATWAPLVTVVWAHELMQFFYFSYYLLLIGVILRILFSADRAAVRDLALRFSGVYLAAYVVYASFPTAGPMRTFPRFAGPGIHGIFRAINDAMAGAGDAIGTAFPSTHVAGAATLAWLAWRHCSRAEAWVAAVLAAGIAPAAVFTQNHFVIDVIVGALLGISLQLVLPEPGTVRASTPFETPPAISY